MSEAKLKVQPGSLIENKKPAEVAAEILRSIFYTDAKHHRQQFWAGVSAGSAWLDQVVSDEEEVVIDFDSLTSEKSKCGTSACVAGWATVLAGYHYRMPKGESGLFSQTSLELHLDKEPAIDKYAIGSEVPLFAKEVLGLDAIEADQLFLHMQNDEAVARLYLMAENDGQFEGLPAWDENIEDIRRIESYGGEAEDEDEYGDYVSVPDMDDDEDLIRQEDADLVEELYEKARAKYSPKTKEASNA